MLLQTLEVDVRAVVDVADEADAIPREHPPQRLDDLLDPRVIGRHPVAHEPVRSRKSVEDVDRRTLVLLGEDVGRVDSCGAGTDDRYAWCAHMTSLVGRFTPR